MGLFGPSKRQLARQARRTAAMRRLERKRRKATGWGRKERLRHQIRRFG